jgi:hypothetical protein
MQVMPSHVQTLSTFAPLAIVFFHKQLREIGDGYGTDKQILELIKDLYLINQPDCHIFGS